MAVSLGVPEKAKKRGAKVKPVGLLPTSTTSHKKNKLSNGGEASGKKQR